MDRATTLQLLRVSGYHGDSREFTRLYTNSVRISKAAAIAAYRAGADQREQGAKCSCYDCAKELAN